MQIFSTCLTDNAQRQTKALLDKCHVLRRQFTQCSLNSSNSSLNKCKSHTHRFSFLKRNKTTNCKQCQDNYSFLLKNKLVDILSSSSNILYYPFLELLHFNSAVFSLSICTSRTPLFWRESCDDHRHRHVGSLTYRQVFPFKMQESTKCETLDISINMENSWANAKRCVKNNYMINSTFLYFSPSKLLKNISYNAGKQPCKLPNFLAMIPFSPIHFDS